MLEASYLVTLRVPARVRVELDEFAEYTDGDPTPERLRRFLQACDEFELTRDFRTPNADDHEVVDSRLDGVKVLGGGPA